jgi:hypothetical protein
MQPQDELGDDRLDITWPSDGAAADSAGSARPWLGIHFECCDVYRRIYRDGKRRRYEGACPRCGRRVSVRIGPGGVATRMLRARLA